MTALEIRQIFVGVSIGLHVIHPNRLCRMVKQITTLDDPQPPAWQRGVVLGTTSALTHPDRDTHIPPNTTQSHKTQTVSDAMCVCGVCRTMRGGGQGRMASPRASDPSDRQGEGRQQTQP